MITIRIPRRGAAVAAALTLALAAVGACSTTTDGVALGAGSGGASAPSGSASAATGAPRITTVWSRKIAGAAGSSTQLTATVSDGSNVYASNIAGEVWALSGTDGHVLWHVHPGRRSGNGPNYADGRVFYNDGDTGLFALDAKTGRTVWRAKTGFTTVGHNILAPVSQGVLVLPDGAGMQGLDALTGKRKWFRSSGPSLDSGAADDKSVYLSGSSYPNDAVTARAIDPLTGATLWSHTVAAPAESDVFVYDVSGVLLQLVASSSEATDDTLSALNPRTGRPLWTVHTTGIQGDQPPAVAQGVVAFGTLDGLRGFDEQSGRLLYTVPADAKVASGATPCGDAMCTIGLEQGIAVDRTGKIISAGQLPGDGVSPTLQSSGPVFVNDSASVFRISR